MSSAGVESTLSTFTASDGDNLAVQDWQLPEGVRRAAQCCWCTAWANTPAATTTLARVLNGWGFAVRGYDQYGHGESDGVRGGLPHPNRLLDDLADLVESTRVAPARRAAHPARATAWAGWSPPASSPARCCAVDGLVLSLAGTGHAPVAGAEAADGGGAARRAQPHAWATASNRITSRTIRAWCRPTAAIRACTTASRRGWPASSRTKAHLVRTRAPSWKVPTLLMYAGDDRLVDPAGSRAFAAAAPPQFVTARCFEGCYHEIFNEPDAEPVYRLPAAVAGRALLAPIVAVPTA